VSPEEQREEEPAGDEDRRGGEQEQLLRTDIPRSRVALALTA
jgi:hypothetical protein